MKKTFLLAITAFVLSAPVAFAEEGVKPMPPEGGGFQHKGNPLFEKADSDGDGMISEGEFLEMHKSRFNEIDTDGSGKISEDEAKAHHEIMRKKMEERREKRRERREERRDDRGPDSGE